MTIFGVILSTFVICSSLWSFHLGTEPPILPLGSGQEEETLDSFPPKIIWTSPAHEEVAYPSVDIVIQFNESMNTSSFSYEFISGTDPGMTWNWESAAYDNDTVRGTHTTLFCSPCEYIFNVTHAEDLAGNALVPGSVPNPWNWTVIVVIIETVPADGETNVTLYKDIIIHFSGPVDPVTWPVPFWIMIPDPGGGWAITWSNGDTSVVLSHAVPFQPCTLYTVFLQIDFFPFPSLVPNPWSFTTVCPPEITITNPAHGEIQVLPESPINVTFSKPMNTTSVNWTIVPYIDLTPSWSQNDTLLTLNHSEYFQMMTLYAVAIMEAKDVDGNNLVPGPVPNPWSFSIMSCTPYVVSTDPDHEEVNVSLNRSVVVEFSHIMDPSSLTWDIDPFINLVPSWSNNNRLLELNHSLDFDNGTQYTIEIHGENKYGNPLVPGPVANPWNFTTCCRPPQILSTDPFDGDENVSLQRPVTIVFSEEMNPESVEWTIDPFIEPTPIWSGQNTILTFQHTEDFHEQTMYTMNITRAEDVFGEALVSDDVPNPWSWTTEVVMPSPPPPAPPTNITAFLSGLQLRDVTISWHLSDDDFPDGNVSHYDVYRGVDSYDSSGLGYAYLGSVPKGMALFVDQLAGQDTHRYFYFVCAAIVTANASSCTPNQAGKFFRSLETGPQLVSMPVIPLDEGIESVLQTVYFDIVWYFDSSSQSWKSYTKWKSYRWQLQTIHNTMGVWVNVTHECNLTVAGMVPASTDIQLDSGWNLVGFPSFNTSYLVSDLKAEVGSTRVEGFDSSELPHFLRVLGDTEVLQAGYGYWVRVEMDTVWTITIE